MIKKEVNAESCSCENCKCGAGCCCGKVLLILLAIIGVVAAVFACIYACKASQTAQKLYDFNVLSAGGEENFNRMNEVYKSEAYVEYAGQQAEQAESYFASNGEDAYVDDESEYDGSSYTAGGEEIKSVVEEILASTPIRGDENARFTIVEYTELHCPYCQRHSQQGTINAAIEQFPGEVNSVSRHFIIHGEDALNLASAMECVAELKPEVYHETFEKAFDDYPVDMEGLVTIATELGVDGTALKTCADEGRYKQAVNDMMSQGAQLFGVNGTPGNVIIDRETGNYIVVSGAYPVESFVEAINELKNA